MHRHSIALLLVTALGGCAAPIQDGLTLEARAGEEAPVLRQAAAVGGVVAEPPSALPARGPTLSLVFVAEGDETLPVREAPAIDAEVIDALDRYTLDVPSTGRREVVHGIAWVEVVTDAGLGWIGAHNTTEFVPTEDFCEAPVVADYALHELANAIHEGNADRFGALLSPTHGLRVRFVPTDEPRHLTTELAATAMVGDQPFDWGADPASGETVRGTFREVVGEELSRAISNGEVTCNRLVTGVAPHVTDVPDSEVSLNFVSVHLPATDDLGMDWVTWTVAFTFEDGRAAIASISRYAWEG